MNLTCTRSGLDATGYDCAALGSTMNPYKCFDNCPSQLPGYGPCCAAVNNPPPPPPSKPRCVYAVTSPLAVSGDDNTMNSPASCSAPRLPSCAGLGTMDLSFEYQPRTCPPSNIDWRFNLSFDRTKLTPTGTPITTATTGISLSYTDYGTSGNDCSQWSGTVTWFSDVPSWKAALDVQCTDPGAATKVHLTGTFNGDVTY
jgi:hypothetical protein